LNVYVALALADSPALEAAFARWQASVSRISKTRRLPEPTLSFGYFIREVETRVGPQRARIGLSQTFPWPTRLSAGADASSAMARAEQQKFDALALTVRKQVVTAYYRLWLIRELRDVHEEHLEVLRSLSESVRARLSIGSATLAEQQQIDLSVARLEDTLRGLDEAETAAVAQLRAATGHWELRAPKSVEAPAPSALPTESEETLRQAAKDHPLLLSYEYQAATQEHLARAKRAEGLPSFSVGADWIITDKAATPGVVDSGKDAVIVGGGISLPLWRGSYDSDAEAAEAEASALRHERRAAEDRALARFELALSSVRDAARRVELHEKTLVPQADAAYASVLGAYAVGQGSVAQTLLAQKDLLEFHERLAQARADHALAWAELEQVVGREVK
jgi:outer membrane protein TolC